MVSSFGEFYVQFHIDVVSHYVDWQLANLSRAVEGFPRSTDVLSVTVTDDS